MDLVVDGDPVALALRTHEDVGGHIVPLDRERGVVRLVFDEGVALDLAPLRGGSLEADLALRDFTVDAIALPPPGAGGGAIDPYGGIDDIRRLRLRAVAKSIFADDGVRLLRAARIAADFGLAPDGALVAAARTDAAHIVDASAERRRDELVRLLATDHAALGLRMLDQFAVLDSLAPELAATRGVAQPKEHYYDVFDHCIETVAALDVLLSSLVPAGRAAEAMRSDFLDRLSLAMDVRRYIDSEPVEGHPIRALTKLGGLLHDIAKPQTKTVDATGRMRFFGHADEGAERAAHFLRELRFSKRETEFVRLLVAEHLRPTQLRSGEGPPTDRAINRFFRDTGDASIAILVLSLADHM
ncbi:MAG TPA: HDIG domain-containing protein, partial [Dehalococcoidia bacterium]|nr:HDIG domain-containing protein [Dehalococcoidia bacterium]